MRNKGFTLIELLAVIIILAIIALIATPIVLNVVNNAKESARKSSVAGYADAVKLHAYEERFKNNGIVPTIDDTFLSAVNYKGDSVTCSKVLNSSTYGVILNECTVAINTTKYCFLSGKVYACDDTNFITTYNKALLEISDASSGVYNEIKGVNKPQLASGMTPIKWIDGVETETTSSDPDWYDYTNKLWANAKTADGSYWVWIPRYAYKISTGWHTATSGTIDIIFLKNDTEENISNTEIQTSGYSTVGTNTSKAYFLEPAFQNSTGNTKYGFWVAKYEASVSDITNACYTTANSSNCNKTTLTPKFVPNVASWRFATIGNQYIVASDMSSNASYGWTNGTVDTHMMTNYEWGTVAYLSNSTYGKNSVVEMNTSNMRYTGGGISDAYKTNVGQSTTGNITGIYDMSGGSFEYVAAYANNNDAILSTNGASLLNATSNKNIYTGSGTSSANTYKANKNIYGDAIYETSFETYDNTDCSMTSTAGRCNRSSWNDNWSYMLVSGEVLARGGDYSAGSFSGIYNFHDNSGLATDYSFRVVSALKQ